MKEDFFKVTLLLIAVFLGLIALMSFFQSKSVLANPGGGYKYDYINIRGADMGGLVVIDMRNGNEWIVPRDGGVPTFLRRYNFDALDKPAK